MPLNFLHSVVRITHSMKKLIVIPLFLIVVSCGKKTRFCSCDVAEVGTKTSVTSMSVPLLVPGVGDTIVENYVYRTKTHAEYSKVGKKEMRATCPVKVEEPIYDRTVSGIDNSVPGLPVGVQLILTTENKGTRTRSCEITE